MMFWEVWEDVDMGEVPKGLRIERVRKGNQEVWYIVAVNDATRVSRVVKDVQAKDLVACENITIDWDAVRASAPELFEGT